MSQDILTAAPQGPPGPLAASAATAADLGTVPTGNLVPGSLAYDDADDAYYRYRPLSTKAVGAGVVAAQGQGRWISSIPTWLTDP